MNEKLQKSLDAEIDRRVAFVDKMESETVDKDQLKTWLQDKRVFINQYFS